MLGSVWLLPLLCRMTLQADCRQRQQSPAAPSHWLPVMVMNGYYRHLNGGGDHEGWGPLDRNGRQKRGKTSHIHMPTKWGQRVTYIQGTVEVKNYRGSKMRHFCYPK